MRITEAQFDSVHLALGDIPSPFRDEALVSHHAHSSNLILNNGGQLSTPSRDSMTFAPVHQLARFPVTLSAFEKKERPWAKRDWLRAELRGWKAPGVTWKSLSPENWWEWRRSFRKAIRVAEGIENNQHDPFREFNFDSCGASKSWGWEVRYADEQTRLTAFSCGETCCPTCYDRDKKRTARRYLNRILAAAKAQGIRRFWTFVITLPEKYESTAFKGSSTRKLLLHEMKKFERKLFGLKTEDGLFAFANIHAVGDSNLMRDRFHVHSGVLPLAIRRINKQAQVIRCDLKGKMDVQAARLALTAHLKKVFPDIDDQQVQFKVQYFSLIHKKKIPQLARRLKYDLRGFGKDIEHSPVFFDPQKQLVVLDGGKDHYGVFTFRQIAERWSWIRNQRDLRSWGLLNQWNKYVDLLGVELVEDLEPEIVEEAPITIARTYGRQWIKERAQPKWVDEKRAFRPTGEEIIEVKWGRRGSEGFWRPSVLPPQPIEGGQRDG